MKRRKVLALRWLMSIVVLSFLLSGCAASTATAPTQASGPENRMESLLAQAGFMVVPQSHPRCQKFCQTLPSGKIVPHRKGSQMIYGYLAPGTNRIYIGDEAAYQRFINLAVMQKLEEQQRPVADESTDPEFWNMWQDLHGGR